MREGISIGYERDMGLQYHFARKAHNLGWKQALILCDEGGQFSICIVTAPLDLIVNTVLQAMGRSLLILPD